MDYVPYPMFPTGGFCHLVPFYRDVYVFLSYTTALLALIQSLHQKTGQLQDSFLKQGPKSLSLSGILTYTAEKHSEVHDSDGPPPRLVIFIPRVITVHKMTRQDRGFEVIDIGS